MAWPPAPWLLWLSSKLVGITYDEERISSLSIVRKLRRFSSGEPMIFFCCLFHFKILGLRISISKKAIALDLGSENFDLKKIMPLKN